MNVQKMPDFLPKSLNISSFKKRHIFDSSSLKYNDPPRVSYWKKKKFVGLHS